MEPHSTHKEIALLRIDGSAVSFLFGAAVLDVPAACANRSTLISDLREQAQDDTSVPLPFCKDELSAWLDCSRGGNARPGACRTIVAGYLRSDDLLQDVDALASAQKVADFLHDTETLAFATRALAALLLPAIPPHVPHPCCLTMPVTAARQLHATKVMRAVPEPFAVDVLRQVHLNHSPGPRLGASVDPDHEYENRSRDREAPAHVTPLLRLLPRHFHTAIFQACCSDATRTGAYTVGTFAPDPDRGAPPRGKVRGRAATARSTNSHGSGAVLRATPTFQLLAAAAPLAGGSMERAWAPGAVAALTAVAPGSGRGSKGGQAACAPREDSAGGCGGDCARDGRAPPCGAPTRLQIHLSHACDQKEPPRWCAALAELCTLTELTVTAASVFALSVPEFTAALRVLPALESLSVEFEDDFCLSCVGETPDFFPTTSKLLDGVSALTQLSSLSLEAGLSFPSSPPPRDSADCAVARLSRLTRLTSLSLENAHFSVEWNDVLASAVKNMCALRELHLGTGECASRLGGPMEALVLDLCTCTQLTALRGVFLEEMNMHEEESGDEPDLQVGRLHQTVAEANPALLQRLTALHLSESYIGAQQNRELAALLRATPALQSLSLSGNELQDSGLISVAAVLPALTALTELDVRDNGELGDSMHAGVLAVLRALLEPGAAGHERLRRLDIGHNLVRFEDTAALPGLLGRLRGLEELDLCCLELGMDGTAAVAKALAALPRLKSLAIWGNMIPRIGGKKALIADVFGGLKHLTRLDCDMDC